MTKYNVNDLKSELICRMTLEDLLENLAENFDELEKYFDFFADSEVFINNDLWFNMMESQEGYYGLDEDDFKLFKESLKANCNFMKEIEDLSPEELKELALRVCSRASGEKFASDLGEKMINALKNQIVEVTENSFNSIMSILSDEIEENGINMNDVPLFKLVEEESGMYSLCGSKIVLACIQLELLKGYGWYYDTLEYFIECNTTLEEAVKGHLNYLKEFNNIYGYDDYFQYEVDVDYLESTTYGFLDEEDMILAVKEMNELDLPNF